MNLSELEKIINESFENKDKINTNSDKSIIAKYIILRSFKKSF